MLEQPRIQKNTMRSFPLTKRYHGFDYVLAKAGERAVIYAQYDRPKTETDHPKLIAYEVFRVTIDAPSERIMAGKVVHSAGGLRWPWNEAFGKWAWSCPTKEQALKRFEQLECEQLEADS